MSKSFLPDSTTDIIRTYSRHKLNLLNQSANCIKRMQKYLRLMNMRLEVVVRDIVGETGSKNYFRIYLRNKRWEKISPKQTL
ncbi:MAG: hypothetical protein IPJ93_00145 [Bacteroidota bacterium]|nr:MAG: hypothetical protein IPJ93_00145 [Bacteroidota bacterium]